MNPYDVPVLRQIGKTVLVHHHTRIQMYGGKPFRATILALEEHTDGHYWFLVRDEHSGERWWVYESDIRAD